ncbi:hypothetical protein L208DRAFT_1448008 [Tricholoma matsutake]|nr:hypothetical protein L208DRAFT_1448008 [Tricholoma matsutake 945]
MSVASGPEAQDALFEPDPSKTPSHGAKPEDVPSNLKRATLRLQFTPTYVIVGAYRLFNDETLYGPAWKKCKHGTVRGAVVGTVWAFLTFKLQRKFIKMFLANSPRVSGLSKDTIFGLPIPFDLPTYAAVLLLGAQMTFILHYFLARNIRIARERAWAQTLASRGKGPDFWGPYVEEWDVPPPVDLGDMKRRGWARATGQLGLFVIKKVLLTTFGFYPFVGILITAWFKALVTAHGLHNQYFDAKKMTPHQIAVFMEERKWDYRIFGFTAALLEGLPIVGLVFTVSNRVGAAMWAHDLEKQQHFIAAQRTNVNR